MPTYCFFSCFHSNYLDREHGESETYLIPTGCQIIMTRKHITTVLQHSTSSKTCKTNILGLLVLIFRDERMDETFHYIHYGRRLLLVTRTGSFYPTLKKNSCKHSSILPANHCPMLHCLFSTMMPARGNIQVLQKPRCHLESEVKICGQGEGEVVATQYRGIVMIVVLNYYTLTHLNSQKTCWYWPIRIYVEIFLASKVCVEYKLKCL